MDARGRWTANVFIERVWHSLKHEDVYLRGYADGREGKARIGEYFAFYNEADSSGARLSGADGRLARRRNAGAYMEEKPPSAPGRSRPRLPPRPKRLRCATL
jgi:hypothetical protein